MELPMLLKNSRIALAQTNCVLGDVNKNIQHHLELIDRAIEEKLDAIVFPELSLTGYTLRDLNFEVALRRNSPRFRPLLERSNKIAIVCGGVEADERGAVYNAAFVLEDGKMIHVHRKIYPPTYGIFEEQRYFSSGRELAAFDSERLGRVGVLVCEDLWHASLPYILAQDNAQLIITIAASPTRLDTGEDAKQSAAPDNFTINREHHSAYARLFGVFMAFVNRVGVEDGVNFWGGSEVVAPSGEPLCRGAFFDPDFTVVAIEPALVEHARKLSRHFLDEDPHLTMRLLSRVLNRSNPPVLKKSG